MNLPLARGGTLHYEVHGAGVPVLLLRPLGGTMALWGAFRAHLAAAHRVISFDLPGTGGSRSARACSTRTLARDAVALLDHLEVARAHVFGLSLGSMIATWLAVDAAPRVDRLCLASTCTRGLDLTWNGIGRELALAACLVARRTEVEPRMVTRVLSARFREEHPDEVARIRATVQADPSSRASIAALALAGMRHDARAVLPVIGAPTLVIAGDLDALAGTAPSRAVSEGIPRAAFGMIARAGHDVTLEQPRATAEHVLAHFA